MKWRKCYKKLKTIKTMLNIRSFFYKLPFLIPYLTYTILVITCSMLLSTIIIIISEKTSRQSKWAFKTLLTLNVLTVTDLCVI